MNLTENGIRTRLQRIQGALNGKMYIHAVRLAEEIPQDSENLAFWKECMDLFRLYEQDSQRALECRIAIEQRLINAYIDDGSLESARFLIQDVEKEIAGDHVSFAMAQGLKRTSEQQSKVILDLKRRN